MDQARKACASYHQNLVTTSQKYAISEKEESHLDCCFAKKRAGGFISRDFGQKTRERLKTYLTTKIRHYIQKLIFFEVFKLFLPLDRSSACFEDGCLQLALRTKTTNHNCARYSCVKALTAKNLTQCYLCF